MGTNFLNKDRLRSAIPDDGIMFKDIEAKFRGDAAGRWGEFNAVFIRVARWHAVVPGLLVRKDIAEAAGPMEIEGVLRPGIEGPFNRCTLCDRQVQNPHDHHLDCPWATYTHYPGMRDSTDEEEVDEA
jgi:hypothetical protein